MYMHEKNGNQNKKQETGKPLETRKYCRASEMLFLFFYSSVALGVVL